MLQEKFTDIIQQKFGVTPDIIEEARKIKNEKGGSLSDILVNRNWITETQRLEALSALLGIPFWADLPLDNIDNEFTEKVPLQFLKRHHMVPLTQKLPAEKIDASAPADAGGSDEALKGYLESIVAINDPTQFQALDDLVRLLELTHYKVVLSTKEAIRSIIDIFYDLNRDSAEQLVQDMEENGTDIISELEETADLLDDTSDAPIIKLVNHIISQSIKARASDIHIEPYQDHFKIRYRVDGILYDLLTPPKWIQPALISRIKVMSKMNIAEKRLPQDGRFAVKIGAQEIDLRVSTLPTSFGERVVMRLLNKTISLLQVAEIGLGPNQLKVMRRLMKSPNGIILVTGPTGSGKTTSLYAVLSEINTPDINIITIEDPVEYQIKGISQIQVNRKIDLTFARGLRSIVRQDPDVILVGEIRDKETAEIAVQSALTGHLVFSTLHTNDSASAITRLVDIGVEPFLISSSVIAVIAQRLVRVLCQSCKKPFVPDDFILEAIGLRPEQLAGKTLYQPVGCQNCFETGYRGRIGIFEILELETNLKRLILKTYDSNQIKRQALQQKMVTLIQDGVMKALKGMTTLDEVLRVTQR